ncbi:GntR family transcriptional regulator [Zongyangia hominis]|uniref:GntR family transcriptional regulator n=1 Tax=Zongyangia hominis TaxID=2763677 RepID=A0A926EC61_9FIRM|nr:GntR family transcriptional regulator [Zongyangia hominis]MBC8570368.1 GntR family transcriptional regulator [Zongyangia hominis]
MDLIVTSASATPLYEQIEQQIKNMILNGELSQGAPLPSIRMLAKELRVSIITVKRAYDDLEAEGFLETAPSKGTFVAIQNMELIRNIAVAQIEEKIAEAVASSRAIKMSLDELLEIVSLLYRDMEEEAQSPSPSKAP